VIGNEGWQRLIAARDAYTHAVSPHYNEVLHQVTHRALTEGSLGKADSGRYCCGNACAPTPAGPAHSRRRAEGDQGRHARRARPSHAARDGRAALSELPGFTSSDALAFAVLTAAAPDRMAVYDRRAHAALHSLGITLTHSRGRYSRYIAFIDRLLAHTPEPARAWTARDMDTALYYLPLVPSASPGA
jgi:hypothetical protein